MNQFSHQLPPSHPMDRSVSFLKEHQSVFLPLFLGALFLALGRYGRAFLTLGFSTSALWLVLIPFLLFLVGALLSPLVFLLESQWRSLVARKLHFEFTHQKETSFSVLRNSLILFLLPILGIFLLTSSRSALGLGFLWGLSLWYGSEVLKMLQGNHGLLEQYFRKTGAGVLAEFQPWLLGYLAYVILLTLGLLTVL